MRRRPIPTVDESLAFLADHGVTDAPATAPDEDAYRGLLDMLAYLAELKKDLRLGAFTWDDPRFVAHDARVDLDVVFASYDGAARHVESAIRDALPRVRADTPTLVALDLHGARVKEYELAHLLYGEVTLFSYPHRPSEPADTRIHDAAEAGWTPTLKAHNLLPGRGIVVLDEHHGLLLTDPAFDKVNGFLVLYEDGQINLHWNPFVRPAKNDAELQHWLAWAEGTAASEWREVMNVEGSPEDLR